MYKTWLINDEDSREPMKPIISKKSAPYDLRGQVFVMPRFHKKVQRCDISDLLKTQQFKDLICSFECILPPISKPMTIPDC